MFCKVVLILNQLKKQHKRTTYSLGLNVDEKKLNLSYESRMFTGFSSLGTLVQNEGQRRKQRATAPVTEDRGQEGLHFQALPLYRGLISSWQRI
jgi:hypothetical protein